MCQTLRAHPTACCSGCVYCAVLSCCAHAMMCRWHRQQVSDPEVCYNITPKKLVLLMLCCAMLCRPIVLCPAGGVVSVCQTLRCGVR